MVAGVFGSMVKRLLQIIFFSSLSFLAAIPVYQSHFLWQPTYDTFYYYARTNEVINGFWQIGNPYYYEHRNDFAVSFFVPDWLSAVPGSFIIWPFVNVLLIFLILKFFGVKNSKLYLGTTFCYVSVLFFIVRPTSLQTVMPFFLIFFLTLARYIQSQKNITPFIIACTATFYIYPYLWQIVIFSLCFLVLAKKGSRWFLLIPVLALPSFGYLWLQIHAPYYWETMERIGLIHTHIPTLDTISYFAMLTMPIIFLRKKLVFLIVHLALTLMLFSPIFTGKELEISSHTARFIALFGAIAIVVLINKNRLFLVLALIWLFLFQRNFWLLGDIVHPPPLPQVQIPETIYQKKVIKARGPLNNYIPFLTNSYVLFHPWGLLHLMSSDEVLERYLVWKYPDKVDVNVLLKDFRDFSGTGPGAQIISHHNYHVRICNLFHLPHCGKIETVYSYYGPQYFQKIIDRYYNDISPNINSYYLKYHVDYIID